MRSTNNERGRRQTRTDLLVTGVSCVVRMRGCFRGAFDSHRRTTVHCGGADLKLTSPTSETIRQCCVQISTPLQWGRRLSTSETRASRESAACSSPLQWGRRLSTSETARTNAVNRRCKCFNGADVFQRRRRHSPGNRTTTAAQLQWGLSLIHISEPTRPY